MQKNNVSVVRRLCAPPPSSPPAPPPSSADSCSLYTSDGINCGGVPAQEEQLRLVSSSFLPSLRASLPLADGEGSFGGLWFWESYRRMLWGCDVLINLGGTGVSLSEDTIETQKLLRRQAVGDCRQGSAADKARAAQRVVCHASAKLEVLFATALSVALHVAQQPILEKAQGPQALILCATKDQCDELTHILNYFCSELHLVVHNLFDLYPSIPSDKRAEIVVGTPPLWDNVIPPSTSATTGTRRVGLEDLLSLVYGGPPPTYVTTRWRPYTAHFISQLVLCDIEQQTSLGYSPLLTRWLRNAGDGALPRDHQLYILMGGGHVPYASEQNSRDALLHELEARLQRTRSSGHTAVEVGLRPTLSLRAPPPNRKRERGKEEGDGVGGSGEYAPPKEQQPMREVVDGAHLTCGVLVRKALSFARLLLDATAFADLRDGIAKEVSAFWSHYHVDVEGTQQLQQHQQAESVLRAEEIVDFSLALVCTTPTETDNNNTNSNKDDALFQEVCLLVQPCTHMDSDKMRPRYTLLFKHLEDKLNGALFDGSVMSFINTEDAQLGVAYQPLPPSTIHHSDSLRLCHALDQGAMKVQCATVYLGARPTRAAAAAATATAARARREEELSRLRAVRQKICKLMEAEEKTHRDASGGDAIDQIPIGTFLRDWDAPAHPFSVLVLRGFALPRDCLCGRPQLGRKPLALFYLEECTQYGRLVSYYCFEMKCSDGSIQTSLFLEFSTHEAAAEAVRMFSFRQDNGTVTAKLFRVGVYYAGVEAEEEKRQGGSDSDDSDLWFDFSLLAE